MDISKTIEYWIKGSEEDFITAKMLNNLNRNVHSLFFCHLTLEKILKAMVCKYTDHQAPYEHNLVRLSELTGIRFSQKQLDDLVEINSFNIRGRYDDYKNKFNEKATKEYTSFYFEKTQELYIWLQQQIQK